jgi:hypothetical protein
MADTGPAAGRTRPIILVRDAGDPLHAAATQVAEAVEKARKISDSLK